jgi:hypothetical protein
METPESGPYKKESIGYSPLAHARYLHATGNGYVTLAHKPGWQQHSYPLEKLYEILPAYSGMEDVYITQNRFYGSRATNRIAELSALYSDLDYYQGMDFENMPPKAVFELALDALLRAKIPFPSLAISTGRGLALVWRHEPVPGHVLLKWHRCQQEIFEALKPLGADSGAIDAARVLRLVGTYNSKSGKLVQSIFENLDEVWDFGELAEEILPLTQEEFDEQQAGRRENEEKLLSEASRRPSKGRKEGQKGFFPKNPVREPYRGSTAPPGASGDGEAPSRRAQRVDVHCGRIFELSRGARGVGEEDDRARSGARRVERGRDQELYKHRAQQSSICNRGGDDRMERPAARSALLAH